MAFEFKDVKKRILVLALLLYCIQFYRLFTKKNGQDFMDRQFVVSCFPYIQITFNRAKITQINSGGKNLS